MSDNICQAYLASYSQLLPIYYYSLSSILFSKKNSQGNLRAPSKNKDLSECKRLGGCLQSWSAGIYQDDYNDSDLPNAKGENEIDKRGVRIY